jgi:hypothetical protein
VDRRERAGTDQGGPVHKHHRVDGLGGGLRAVALQGQALGFQEADAVEQLGGWVGTVVLATDEYRGLDELVGDGSRERIPVDELSGAAWR